MIEMPGTTTCRECGSMVGNGLCSNCRTATAAIAAAKAPPLLTLLDNTVFLDAARALGREFDILSAWSEDEEASDVLAEAIQQLRLVGELAWTGAPNERGYPEITVRVQGVSAEGSDG